MVANGADGKKDLPGWRRKDLRGPPARWGKEGKKTVRFEVAFGNPKLVEFKTG